MKLYDSPTCLLIRGSYAFSGGYTKHPQRLYWRFIGEASCQEDPNETVAQQTTDGLCGWLDLDTAQRINCLMTEDLFHTNPSRKCLDAMRICCTDDGLTYENEDRFILHGHWPGQFRITQEPKPVLVKDKDK